MESFSNYGFNSESYLTPLRALDTDGILITHDVPAKSNDSDEEIVKRYEPEEFDFLTMSVGNEEKPIEYGSVDEFIHGSLNESMQCIEESNDSTTSPLVNLSQSPNNSDSGYSAGEMEVVNPKKRGRKPKPKGENIDSNITPAPKKHRIRAVSDSHPNPILAEENYREYKLPHGWIKTAHRRQNGMSAGHWDIYLHSPTGERFRSNPELKKFLAANPNIEVDLSVTVVKRPAELEDMESRQPKRKSEPIKPTTASSVGWGKSKRNSFNEAIKTDHYYGSEKNSVTNKKLKKLVKKAKISASGLKKGVKKLLKKRGRPPFKRHTCTYSVGETECGLQFKKIEDFEAHKLTHDIQGRLFECGNCRGRFATIQDLRGHVDSQSCFGVQVGTENLDLQQPYQEESPQLGNELRPLIRHPIEDVWSSDSEDSLGGNRRKKRKRDYHRSREPKLEASLAITTPLVVPPMGFELAVSPEPSTIDALHSGALENSANESTSLESPNEVQTSSNALNTNESMKKNDESHEVFERENIVLKSTEQNVEDNTAVLKETEILQETPKSSKNRNNEETIENVAKKSGDDLTKKANKFIKCSPCQFYAKNKNEMITHMVESHFSPIKADTRSTKPQVARKSGPRSSKRRSDQQVENLKCEKCMQSFKKITFFRAHVRRCEF